MYRRFLSIKSKVMHTGIPEVLLAIIVIFTLTSCAVEEQIEPIDNVEDNNGSLKGSVRLFDRYGDELLTYNDITLKVFDEDSIPVSIQLGTDGNFLTPEFKKGISHLYIDKPGFIGLQTMRLENSLGIDSLPPILLFEDLDFAWVDFSMYYDEIENFLWSSRNIDFETNENIMVGDYIYLSTDQNVSYSNYMMQFNGGGGSNLAFINGGSSGTKVFIDRFIDRGFKQGDVIYAVNYAVSSLFNREFYWQDQVFDIISIKLNKPSNQAWFILR
jgi:hypothetical protein